MTAISPSATAYFMNSRIINALNLIKVFGAGLVVTAHYSGIFFGRHFFSFGTGCFFVVAGYYALTWERSRGLTYLGKRLIRLYPGYLAAVLAYLLILHPAWSQWPELLMHHLIFLLSASRVETVYALNPAFWSMPVFVTFFIIVAFLPRLKPTFLGAVVLATLPFVTLALGGMSWRNGYLQLLAFPLYLYAFWLGGAIGQLAHRQSLCSHPRYTWLALALVVVVILMGAFYHGLNSDSDHLYTFIYNEVMVSLYGLLLWAILHSPLIGRRLRAVDFAGAISFGVYLFHDLPPHLLQPLLSPWAGAVLSLGCALLLAWLCLKYIEKPAQNYLKPRLMRLTGHALPAANKETAPLRDEA